MNARLRSVREIAAGFPAGQATGRYFVEGDDEAVARELGACYWPDPQAAYSNFLYAYAALFAIPSFVAEALARQPSRFDRDQLPHTVATTSGFILDAFGFDRRMNRPREVIYSPAPTIRALHSRRANAGGRVKERISDAAMIYFATHLMRSAEWRVASGECRHASLDTRHFRYFRGFFRDAGYRFPEEPEDALLLCARVDEELAGDEYAFLWEHLPEAAQRLEVRVDADDLGGFLLPRSAVLFRQATSGILGPSKILREENNAAGQSSSPAGREALRYSYGSGLAELKAAALQALLVTCHLSLVTRHSPLTSSSPA